MPWTNLLPPDTRAVGLINPPADVNGIVDALVATNMVSFNVQNPLFSGGADGTGVTAADTALASVTSGLGTNNGLIYVPTGTYKITSGWILNIADTQQLVIVCAPGVVFNYSGSGDCIRMLSAAVVSTNFGRGSGIVGFPIIDGTSAGAGAAGLHFGDIFQGRVDVGVTNFSGVGSMGVHFDNTIAWTEQLTARIYARNNTSAIVFDESGAITSTGSYARVDLNAYILSGAVTNSGVVLQNGAQLYHGTISIRGNFTGAASGSPGAVLSVIGQGPGSHPNSGAASNILGCQINIGVESGAAVVSPQTIKYGTTANTITQCYGYIQFTGGATWTGSSVSTNSTFGFMGPINGDASLVESDYTGSWGMGAIVTGNTIVSNVGQLVYVNPAAAVTGIIIASGLQDGQQLTVVNVSNFTVAFAAFGTSHVVGGVSTIIPPTSSQTFTWRTANSAWYPNVSNTSNTAGSAPVLTPSFANNTAAQLTDTTRDYMVYLAITTSGTATTVAIGPTSVPANTILPSSAVTAGQLISFRLPAGWWVKWAGTTTAIATQTAIGC